MANFSPVILPISNPQHTTDATTTTTQQPVVANSTVRSLFSQISSTVHSSLSNSRPWPELVDQSAFSKPESISNATLQIRKNYAYFQINYLSIITVVLAISLLRLGSRLGYRR
ncbi:PRA1 family protein B4 [Forsythia ovata]|uniref:PRA1 family protein n=1 Tax=Forsythia ovata TaxID=205694 RepID=A0ABD1T3P5_9LAMI